MNTILNMDINRKYEIKNLLYTISWCMLFIQVLFIDNNFPYLPFNITVPAFALLLISAVFPFDYNLKEIITIAIAGIFVLLICYYTKIFAVFWIFAFISCSKGILLRPLFFKTLVVFSLVFIIATILSQTGIIEDKIRYATADAKYPKHYLGLKDPNYAHLIFLIIINLIFALYYNRLTFLHLFILMLLNTGVFLLTFCKTSAAIIYFMIIAAFTEKILAPHISKKIYTSILILLFICMLGLTIFMIFVPMLYNPAIPWHQKVNDFLTGRVVLSKNFFTWYNLTPFGNYIIEFSDPNSNIYMDIGFSVLLIQYGYIFSIFFILGYSYLFIRYIHEKNFVGILLILSVFLQMAAENYVILFFYNFTYVLLRSLIFKTDKPDELFTLSNT